METRKPKTGFDTSRINPVGTRLFVPFDVTRTSSLAGALKERVVRRSEPVLVLEPGESRPPLVFVTSQMTYHHIAQGELEGTPFAATF